MVVLVIEGNLICWRSHGGSGRKSFNPLYKEREYVQWQMKAQYIDEIIDQPVKVTYFFHFPIPSSISRKKYTSMISGKTLPTIKKDGTNLVKFYEDCLKGVIIRDDCLVTECIWKKIYSSKPLVTIFIEKIQLS